MEKYIRQLPGYKQFRHKQEGAMLVVVLIVLLIVSMLGMSTMDTTGLEMRMVSNSRDQQSAFEAAEYTLSWVQNNFAGGGFTNSQITNASDCGNICFEETCSNGFCFLGEFPDDLVNCKPVDPANPPAAEPYEDATLWADGNRHQTLPVGGLTVKYIVEFRCYTALDPTQEKSATNSTRLFRITAFATGPGGRGRVMLRSAYKDS